MGEKQKKYVRQTFLNSGALVLSWSMTYLYRKKRDEGPNLQILYFDKKT